MSKAAIRRSEPSQEKPVDRASGAKMQVLIGPDDAPNFLTRKFTLQPGGRIPAHRHPHIEHEQFILRGSMQLGIDDDVHEVGAGEAVYIPAGSAHWYVNEGTEPVEFLCIVPKTATYDTEWLD